MKKMSAHGFYNWHVARHVYLFRPFQMTTCSKNQNVDPLRKEYSVTVRLKCISFKKVWFSEYTLSVFKNVLEVWEELLSSNTPKIFQVIFDQSTLRISLKFGTSDLSKSPSFWITMIRHKGMLVFLDVAIQCRSNDHTHRV